MTISTEIEIIDIILYNEKKYRLDAFVAVLAMILLIFFYELKLLIFYCARILMKYWMQFPQTDTFPGKCKIVQKNYLATDMLFCALKALGYWCMFRIRLIHCDLWIKNEASRVHHLKMFNLKKISLKVMILKTSGI